MQNLNVRYPASNGRTRAGLSGVGLQMSAGEIVGIYGASGSGKTSLGLALLDLLPENAERCAQAIHFRGRNLLYLNDSDMRRIRGKEISIMYQEPALALNPVMRVGDQIAEVIRAHERTSRRKSRERVWNLLRGVCLDRRPEIYDAYPHELSGGECHRIVIAQAVACRPSLVIADEPTAGLDEQLKPAILDLIARLRTELHVSFLLISHDRKMLGRVADRLLEMSAGCLREPRADELCIAPTGKIRKDECPETESLVVIRELAKAYSKRGLIFRSSSPAPALRDVNLTIPRGCTFGLVGPSGSGKSTLARCLALWDLPDSGQILFRGKDIAKLSAGESRRMRPQIQLIVQDSAAAFNPNLTAEEVVEEPLLIRSRHTDEQRRREVLRLFQETGLEEGMLRRKVLELSGGERQRLAIARALTLEPTLIIFDESTSGLDSETQQRILTLLAELKRLHDLTYLVISHDLELTARIADHVAVMRNGTIVGSAPTFAASGKMQDLFQNGIASSDVDQSVALRRGA